MKKSFLTAEQARIITKAAVTDPIHNSSLRKPYMIYKEYIEEEIGKAALSGDSQLRYCLYCTSTSTNEKLAKILKDSLEKNGYSVEIDQTCNYLTIRWGDNDRK